MFIDIPEKTSVLIDGPGEARVVSGRVSAFGAILSSGSEFSIALGKRLPIFAQEKSSIDLLMDEGGSYSQLDHDPIPQAWKSAAEEIIESGLSKVMVIGEIDSGKSSFCLFLSNFALAQGKRTAIVDADVGQSDIGPPGSVGLAMLSEQRTTLRGIEPSGLSFVGTKNPSLAMLPLLRSVKRMRKRALKMPLDLLIINTDGWVSGDSAAYLKHVTAEIFGVQAVVAIHKDDELDSVISVLEDYDLLLIESPGHVMNRDRDLRREIRRDNFARFMREREVRSFPLGIVHGLNPSDDWRGLLVGLEGERWRLLGIGTIELVDWGANEIWVSTAVKSDVKSIQVGKIRLDKDCNEIEDI